MSSAPGLASAGKFKRFFLMVRMMVSGDAGYRWAAVYHHAAARVEALFARSDGIEIVAKLLISKLTFNLLMVFFGAASAVYLKDKKIPSCCKF